MAVLARITIRSSSAKPLSKIALQISSSLHWDGVSVMQNGTSVKLPFDQHMLETDADHTGAASECLISLPEPLKPGASSKLTLLYSGAIHQTGVPLGRLGASETEVARASWDVISPEGTFLRGFGDVLWYPVASAQVFLGDGSALSQAAGQQMLRQSAAPFRIRVSAEYTGKSPAEILFCGRQGALRDVKDQRDAPFADASGVATAEFSLPELGFRIPSLFVTNDAVLGNSGIVRVVSADTSALDRLTAASAPISAFLSEWLGKGTDRNLTVIDHRGVSYADHALLVAPVSGADADTLVSELAPGLANASFRSAHGWLDQGVPQFLTLLWIERTKGRPALMSSFEEQLHALSFAEAMTHPARSGGLLAAVDPVFYRVKAMAVLWQLRGIVGDDALKVAIDRYSSEPHWDRDAHGFQKLVEEVSAKDLRWFFDDWVYEDHGLPDLSIASVTPRALASTAAGRSGWLVAVEVRNEGDAAAEVPVTIRSGALTATERLRINAHAAASTRILFQGTPQEVQVNDGSVPETASSVHTESISVR